MTKIPELIPLETSSMDLSFPFNIDDATQVVGPFFVSQKKQLKKIKGCWQVKKIFAGIYIYIFPYFWMNQVD